MTEEQITENELRTEKLKVDAKSLVMSILITLILFAIPQIEKSRRMEINELFGVIVQ